MGPLRSFHKFFEGVPLSSPQETRSEIGGRPSRLLRLLIATAIGQGALHVVREAAIGQATSTARDAEHDHPTQSAFLAVSMSKAVQAVRSAQRATSMVGGGGTSATGPSFQLAVAGSAAVALDHEWQAPPNGRAGAGAGCPACAGQQVSVTNSLAALFPAIAAEWHPSKNETLSPVRTVAGSGRKVWWKCSAGQPDTA